MSDHDYIQDLPEDLIEYIKQELLKTYWAEWDRTVREDFIGLKVPPTQVSGIVNTKAEDEWPFTIVND